VWQIAQRDYKFGKGKHSSLTNATYNAVANRFRALWGEEAGWAHSVLFTADLKAFSERLVEKVETVTAEAIVKQEGDGVIEETIKEDIKVTTKRVKRESDESEHVVMNLEAKTERMAKRRRKA
jgi:N-glycosylase/DNA lyase